MMSGFKKKPSFPMPSSKTRDDAEYDGRIPQILMEVAKGRQVDIRELVVMKRSVQQSHLGQERVSIPELVDSMSLDEGIADPAPHSIGIFDDVITTGRHFRERCKRFSAGASQASQS